MRMTYKFCCSDGGILALHVDHDTKEYSKDYYGSNAGYTLMVKKENLRWIERECRFAGYQEVKSLDR